MSIRLLIASRIYLFAEGLKRLLSDHNGFDILGIACGTESLQEMLTLDPDIVVTDQAMCRCLFGKPNGGKARKILLIIDGPSLSPDDGDLKEMVSKGLAGVLSNRCDSKLLKKALFSVHSGELWIDHKTIKNSFNSPVDEGADIVLTKREKEILQHLGAGLTNKEIAQKLFITEQTVKSHCNHLYKKFGVSNRTKLALCVSDMANRMTQ